MQIIRNHTATQRDFMERIMAPDIQAQLNAIAAGRTHLPNHEAAHVLNHAPQYLRKLNCLNGEAFGIRPIKIGGKLMWPVAGIAAVLNGGAK